MRAANTDLPISTLRECFRLCEETGRVFWLERPLIHFSREWAWRVFNKRWAGGHADTSIYKQSGYRKVVVSISGRVFQLTAHRVAFALANGRWPSQFIDHIDNDKQNNRPTNLRDVSHAQNMQNIPIVRGAQRRRVRGAYMERNGKWRALIRVNGVTHHLGTFADAEDAHTAYAEAKRRLHPICRA